MLAEHIKELLEDEFTTDIVVEITGDFPDREEIVSIELTCPEGVDPEERYKDDPPQPETDFSILVRGLVFNNVRNKTREIIKLLDKNNLSAGQLVFSDEDRQNYGIIRQRHTAQVYARADKGFTSTITFTNKFNKLT